jgi:hypothetical protein
MPIWRCSPISQKCQAPPFGQDNEGEAATLKAPSNVIDRRDDSQLSYRIEAMGSAISHTWQVPETGSNVINSVRAPIPAGNL